MTQKAKSIAKLPPPPRYTSDMANYYKGNDRLATEAMVRKTATIPVGTIVSSLAASPADGWLLCDGQEVSRTQYDELFAVLGVTYGAGDGSTTFNLPDFRGRTIWGASSTQPMGTVISAGLPSLPSHKHDIGFSDYKGTAYGEKSISTSHYLAGYGSAAKKALSAYTSAASTNSNAIYGASSTVQPPAIAVNIFIKA